MNISFPETIPKIRNYLQNPFYRNSFYITLGRVTDVGFGFLFWTLAARLYSISEVGIATALISSLSLVMIFSSFGFDFTAIRFMPSHDHNRVFNTCLWITTAAAIVAGTIYLTTIDLISSEIAFIRDYAPLFLIFAVVNSVTLITGSTLLSLRKADLKFIQNIIMGVRLPLLLPLTLLGGLGVFYSFGFAYLIATIFALAAIRGYVTLTPQIDWEFARKTFSFSSFNYLANLFLDVPTYIMPILIVNLLNPNDAALYYIAFAIGNLVLIIPNSMSTAFFVEGSHGINLRKGVFRNLVVTYAVLIPTVLIVVTFGEFPLGLFGKNYLVAFDLLKVIAISSLFVTIYNLFIPLQNIRLQVRGIVIINMIRFVLLLGLSYILLTWFGVIGAGYAWMITHIMLSAGIAAFAKSKGWI